MERDLSQITLYTRELDKVSDNAISIKDTINDLFEILIDADIPDREFIIEETMDRLLMQVIKNPVSYVISLKFKNKDAAVNALNAYQDAIYDYGRDISIKNVKLDPTELIVKVSAIL